MADQCLAAANRVDVWAHGGASASLPPSLPPEKPWAGRVLEFAPEGMGGRIAYLAVGVVLGLGCSMAVLGWLRDWRWRGIFGAPSPWSLFLGTELLLRVVVVPVFETVVGYGMFAGLQALRVRPVIQLGIWTVIWAHLHYWYQGNALVVFPVFLLIGICMIAYRMRSTADSLLMGAALHIAYNAAVEVVKWIVQRWGG